MGVGTGRSVRRLFASSAAASISRARCIRFVHPGQVGHGEWLAPLPGQRAVLVDDLLQVADFGLKALYELALPRRLSHPRTVCRRTGCEHRRPASSWTGTRGRPPPAAVAVSPPGSPPLRKPHRLDEVDPRHVRSPDQPCTPRPPSLLGNVVPDRMRSPWEDGWRRRNEETLSARTDPPPGKTVRARSRASAASGRSLHVAKTDICLQVDINLSL